MELGCGWLKVKSFRLQSILWKKFLCHVQSRSNPKEVEEVVLNYMPKLQPVDMKSVKWLRYEFLNDFSLRLQ